MRVLIVTHYIPHFPGPGAPSREYCLARELATRHEITYLIPSHQSKEVDKVAALSSFCHVRFTDPPGNRKPLFFRRVLGRVNRIVQNRLPINGKIKQIIGPSIFLKKWEETVQQMKPTFHTIDWTEFDLVQIEHSQLANLVRQVSVPLPCIVDWIDIHSSIQERIYQTTQGWNERWFAMMEWRKLSHYERWVASRVDHSLAMSELDAARLRQLCSTAQVSVVPNGVNCDYFHNPDPDNLEDSTLVYTGLMDYEPNVEAVLFFCDKILPFLLDDFPNIVFYIVGSRPAAQVLELAERYPGKVFVTGFVDDVRPFLQRATVSIAPLLNGGGTRLKILEAMSMQKAVVSSHVGCEGINLIQGKHAFVADDPVAFSKAIKILLCDKDTRSRIASEGYQLARDCYDWKYIATKMESTWQKVVPS
jgi:glycosyltransferase involved in cell wall biosynthesis